MIARLTCLIAGHRWRNLSVPYVPGRACRRRPRIEDGARMIRRPPGTATPAPTPDPQQLASAVRKVGTVYALGAMVRRGWAEGA